MAKSDLDTRRIITELVNDAIASTSESFIFEVPVPCSLLSMTAHGNGVPVPFIGGERLVLMSADPGTRSVGSSFEFVRESDASADRVRVQSSTGLRFFGADWSQFIERVLNCRDDDATKALELKIEAERVKRLRDEEDKARDHRFKSDPTFGTW